jgi:hypothetical protein
MLQLIERIRERLAQGAYANEAAISHGVVTPILNALGWDSADPQQLVPEFSIPGRGRIDFAVFTLGQRPAVFIEVKGVGLTFEGDRQLFEYAFHEGVPFCVLTDGRQWSFYLPGGQGSYDDRRVYRLQLDDREPEECARILTRYLARERVRDGSALIDAQKDYRDAAGRRQAVTALPRAWAELVEAPHELLIETVGNKAEALCGFKPSPSDVASFLARLVPADTPLEVSPRRARQRPAMLNSVPAASDELAKPNLDLAIGSSEPVVSNDRTVTARIFGQERSYATASLALVDILRSIATRDPAKIGELSARVKGRTRSLIARTPNEINPNRPDLARAAEFSPGWLVGLNVSNREKMAIITAACDVMGLTMPDDIGIVLPNA